MAPRPLTDSPAESHREVVHRLAAAQKSNRGAAGWSRWVNRPAGRQLAALAYRLGLSPNQVTVASALLSGTGIALLATLRPTVGTGVLVASLLVLGYMLDAADGQLARLTGSGSRAGEWLDHVVDATKTAVIHLAVLISFYRFLDLPPAMLLVPLAFSAVACVFFFSVILSEQLRRSARAALGAPASPPSTEPAPVLRSLLVLPGDYGLLCVSFALLGVPTVFVPLYTLLMVANALLLLAALVRWYREMRTFTA